MVPMICLTLSLIFGAAVVMAAVSPSTHDHVTSMSSINSSTASFLTSISTTRETKYITMQNDTKHEPINCSNTESHGEVFSCFLQGMLSEPLLIGLEIIIFLAALFVIYTVVRSKFCRNGWKTVNLNMDEEKKMIA